MFGDKTTIWKLEKIQRKSRKHIPGRVFNDLQVYYAFKNKGKDAIQKIFKNFQRGVKINIITSTNYHITHQFMNFKKTTHIIASVFLVSMFLFPGAFVQRQNETFG